jgi:hypothetical protein
MDTNQDTDYRIDILVLHRLCIHNYLILCKLNNLNYREHIIGQNLADKFQRDRQLVLHIVLELTESSYIDQSYINYIVKLNLQFVLIYLLGK